MNKIISVVSGKGGTGKTTFTINAANVLFSFNKNVLIIDLDFGLNKVDLYLNLDLKSETEKIIKYKKEYSLEELKNSIYNYKSQNGKKFDVISGSSGNLKMTSLTKEELNNVINFIKDISSFYDFVIIDNSPGISNTLYTIIKNSNFCFVITTKEYPALIDCYQTIKLAILNKEINCFFYLIFNFTDEEEEAILKFNSIKNILRQYIGDDNKDKLNLVKYGGNILRTDIFSESILQNKLPTDNFYVKKIFSKILKKGGLI